MKSRLFILTLGAFAIGTDGFIIAGITSSLVNDLGISYAAAGQLVTVFAFVVAIFAPILATVTANMNRKHLLVGTLGVFTIGNLISALAPSFTWLMISRVIAAIGAALYTPISTTVAASIVPKEQQGRAIAFVSSGLTIAITLGVPIGTWIGNNFGWRISFAIIAIAGLLALIGIQLFLPSVQNESALPLKQRLSPLKQLPVITFLVSCLGVTIGSFALHTYINPILREVGDLGDTGISIMLAIFGLACVVGVWIGGIMTDKIGAISMLMITIIAKCLTLAGFALLLMIPSSATTIFFVTIAIIMWGITSWALNPAVQKHLFLLAPQAPMIVLSLNATFLFIGIGLGSSLGGLFLQYSSMSNLGWASSFTQLLSLGMLAISMRLLPFKSAKR
jgi:predicted MFS family arabinose efflux permease